MNDGRKDDQGKPDFTYLRDVRPGLEEVCKVLAHGADTYGRANFRKVESFRYDRALLRHALHYDGPDVDSKSGLPHAAHVAACALIQLTNDALKRAVWSKAPNGDFFSDIRIGVDPGGLPKSAEEERARHEAEREALAAEVRSALARAREEIGVLNSDLTRLRGRGAADRIDELEQAIRELKAERDEAKTAHNAAALQLSQERARASEAEWKLAHAQSKIERLATKGARLKLVSDAYMLPENAAVADILKAAKDAHPIRGALALDGFKRIEILRTNSGSFFVGLEVMKEARLENRCSLGENASGAIDAIDRLVTEARQ